MRRGKGVGSLFRNELDAGAVRKQLQASVEFAAQADPLDAQLLPHIMRYYQVWHDESLSPHHVVNSH